MSSVAKAARLLALGMALTLSPTSHAGQTLIPTPYPSAVPGAAPLDPEPIEPGDPQTLIRDPYPQVTGDFSQGNPPIVRHHRRQHLVPSLYKRKYRVEQH